MFWSMPELNRAAASMLLQSARQSVESRAVFHLVLAGGKTPRGLYEMLAAPPFARQMPWRQTHIWWGDERLVPPDHPHSNYRLAHEALLSHVPIPSGNIHPAHAGARAYERELHEAFPGKTPDFDLVLLGMGPDGHTASLFPGTPALDERSRFVVEVRYPQADPPVPRITMTLPLFDNAHAVIFLVAGAEKAAVVDAILRHRGSASRLPAARVRASRSTIWLVFRPDSDLLPRPGAGPVS